MVKDNKLRKYKVNLILVFYKYLLQQFTKFLLIKILKIW